MEKALPTSLFAALGSWNWSMCGCCWWRHADNSKL